MPRRRAEHGHQKPGCCELLLNLICGCGMCCFMFCCPPIPSIIVKKFAFHPPEKDLTYRIVSKNESDRKIKNISDLKNNEDIELIIRKMDKKNEEHCFSKEEVEVFSVETDRKNNIVCVRCYPKQQSKHSQLQDQVILFCQPNSSDLGGYLQPTFMNFLSYANYFEMDVFAFDYSGFGYSSGSPSEKNINSDVRAVYKKVRELCPEKRIVLFGFSIGTTAVIDLASSNPDDLAGVILVAPFTSGIRLMTGKADDPKTCCADSFTSYDKIGKIDCKVLICHGDSDEMIPLIHGLTLNEKLKNPAPIAIIRGATHQNILSPSHITTFDRILRFLKTETNLSSRSNERKRKEDKNEESVESEHDDK
ncbi:unnamed protein product [Caenorhabditis angaria]|uniref:Serine aminopeptidase S33 domain-containing protein n=1 Tax=Caenorhabditis angaria TaxID=860376 RepID=A0A9P1MWP2_9PELO|nr:unnamed protein product [Caenorhabditis angaria]